MRHLTHLDIVWVVISELLLNCVDINSLFLPFRIEDVRIMYSRNALTGHKQPSGSLCPTKSLNEGIMIGENAWDPSVAALVLGRKSLTGYSVTEPFCTSNSTLEMSRAWISDLLRPLANKTKKNVL
jgi:hypothetical protein